MKSSTNYKNLTVTQRSGVGIVTLNRPSVLNALSTQLFQELDEVFADLDTDPEVKVIIITGAGDRAFSAGADIHEMARLSEMGKTPKDHSSYYWGVATVSKPTIGAINGLAYGGGALIASTVDIRIGCERTKFRFLAANYGRINSTWTLPMVVGMPIAKELLFSGRIVDSDEAYRIGLLNRLVSSEQLMTASMELAETIANNHPAMVQGIKQLLLEDIGTSWEGMLENEIKLRTNKLEAPPIKEAFKHFLSKRGGDGI